MLQVILAKLMRRVTALAVHVCRLSCCVLQLKIAKKTSLKTSILQPVLRQSYKLVEVPQKLQNTMVATIITPTIINMHLNTLCESSSVPASSRLLGDQHRRGINTDCHIISLNFVYNKKNSTYHLNTLTKYTTSTTDSAEYERKSMP